MTKSIAVKYFRKTSHLSLILVFVDSHFSKDPFLILLLLLLLGDHSENKTSAFLNLFYTFF